MMVIEELKEKLYLLLCPREEIAVNNTSNEIIGTKVADN